MDSGFWCIESIQLLLTLEGAEAAVGVGEVEHHLVEGVGLALEGLGQQGLPEQPEGVGHWNLPILSCCCRGWCSLTGGLGRV